VSERDEDLETLLAFIRDERAFDFTGYKRPSLERRITRRMQDLRIDSFAGYREFLERNQDEFAQLFDTILINVTSFFRDPAAWQYIQSEVVQSIADRDGGHDPIRVWTTGCSTGEEAYTVAMVFAEVLGEHAFKRRVKIYATDVDDSALTIGRTAAYTEQQIAAVPPELREKYFEPVNGSYAFRGDLRRSVIFGRHDLVKDPPISRIDFLVSRNTLMYFDSATQRRVLSAFHFALRPEGYLFLGKSEVLAARTGYFTPVDLKRRVFAKVDTSVPRERPSPESDDAARDLQQQADQGIREAGFEVAPVAQIVVDLSGRVVAANVQGRMQFGLAQQDVGMLLQDLELSYRPLELRSRIEQAYTEGQALSVRDVEWQAGNETRYLDIHLHPLTDATGERLGVAIAFFDVTRYRRLQEILDASKREAEVAHEELQSTVEELETTNEELQSTNEELETTNEELQSTNEELETMNEELQSTNEELETMNDELQLRADELTTANAFLDGVLGSLSSGVVVIDKELKVEAWNGGSYELWGLRADETVGRHLLNLDIGLPLEPLRKPIRVVLAGGAAEPLRLEALNRRGRQIEVAVRLNPLTTTAHGVIGVVLMVEPIA